MKPRDVLIWAGIVVLSGAWLTWRELAYRAAAIRSVATLQPEPVLAVPRAETPLPVTSLALAFGLTSSSEPVVSQAPLQFKASIVPSEGAARALIAADAEQRFYQVGDALPGGGVLRRIDTQAIQVWANDREEAVPLLSTAPPVFVSRAPLEQGAPPTPTPSPRMPREVQ